MPPCSRPCPSCRRRVRACREGGVRLLCLFRVPTKGVTRQVESIDRRDFLRLAGLGALATAGGSFLAGCGDAKTGGGPGTTDKSQLSGLLPAYVPSDVVKPDVPSVE